MKKRNNLIDILKFVAAIMVVGIHTGPLNSFNILLNNVIFQGVARLAVPFFFVISAYFLFSKYKKNKDIEVLYLYIKRLGKLYLFWFIVLFPVIFKIRYLWLVPELGRKGALFAFIKELIWSSSFQGSWYLNASMVCACIIFILQKKMNMKKIFIVCSCCFMFSVVVSGYYELFSSFIGNAYEKYVYFFSEPYNTFVVGMIYFALGKYIAETERENLWLWKVRRQALVVSVFFVVVEALCMHVFGYFRAPDCFVSLLPASYFIVINTIYFEKEIHVPERIMSFMRESSIIMYIIHFRVLDYVTNVGAKYGIFFPNTFVAYLVILLICLLISFCILQLEKIKIFGFLKYSH